ncbi:MAG TPA: hypothetical protein P5567_09620 [Kiritimatiellia bacterium]|nr:hypothetical protein [Kiritimatiellia bacterium]HRZ12698.1 hypothetical protein [Kiritimatiellia bacterium]HSA19534.1 hypothetical protein [Kiritimatiellia bacterium]
MRTLALAVVMALIGSIAVFAEDIAIKAFDVEGRISFDEVADAWMYQVNWTTNLGETTWRTSSPPGVARFAAQGDETRVVTVGLQNASCFFRIEATNYPPATRRNGPDSSRNLRDGLRDQSSPRTKRERGNYRNTASA